METLSKDWIATITLGFTAITFFVVCYQAYIARQEFSAVKSDVANNKVLFERANRKSKLWPFGKVTNHFVTQFRGEAHERGFTFTISIKNMGELPDLRRKIVIGIHKDFDLRAHDGEIGYRWKTQEPYARGCYQDFQFVYFSSDEPIYPKDSIELPPYLAQSSKFPTEDLNLAIIIGRVSSDYERNPENAREYLRLNLSHFSAEFAKPVNIFAKNGGMQVPAFDQPESRQ